MSKLHQLILEDKPKEVEKIVKKDKKSLLEPNRDGQLPLMVAVEQGKGHLVELLISLGADARQLDTKGWSALHFAALNQQYDLCKLLLDHNADPNARTAGSLTSPLHYLVRHQWTKELEAFLDVLFNKGVEVDLKNNYGETPLHYAVMRCSEPAAAYLLKKKANVNHQNDFGETPLHKACRLGPSASNLIRLLLAHGADVNVTGRNGTPAQLMNFSLCPELKPLFEQAQNTVRSGGSSNALLGPLSARVSGSGGWSAGKSISSPTLNNPQSANITPTPTSAVASTSSPAIPKQTPVIVAPISAQNDVIQRTLREMRGSFILRAPPAHTADAPVVVIGGGVERHASPVASPSPLANVASPESPHAAHPDDDSPSDGMPPIIIPKPGFRLELGKRNPLKGVTLNMYDYTDHYKNLFYGKHETEPTVVTVLEDAETGSFPEPIFRGIVRNSKSGQDQFFITTGDVLPLELPKKIRDPRKKLARQLQKFLQETFFLGSRLWLVKDETNIQAELLELERNDPERSSCFAFGVVYAKEGNKSAIEYWENEHGSPEFERFLRLLGDKVELKGWSGFRGGLDVANDAKGTHSVYTKFQDKFEIMFHVSTLLPFHPLDPLKIVRARQIQNDVVVVIFQEGLTPYNPEIMPTSVSHIFAIVQPVKVGDEICYRLGVAEKSTVTHTFRPDIPSPSLFHHNDEFRTFLLTKLINGQIAARKSGLSMMFTRPRQAMLQDMVHTYRAQDAD